MFYGNFKQKYPWKAIFILALPPNTQQAKGQISISHNRPNKTLYTIPLQ